LKWKSLSHSSSQKKKKQKNGRVKDGKKNDPLDNKKAVVQQIWGPGRNGDVRGGGFFRIRRSHVEKSILLRKPPGPGRGA